ncbi:MAG: protein kinase [Myxococcota bacterium]
MADSYRPLFKLDSGGMAEVYVAEAESVAGFTKKVAIKRILPALLKEERFVRMFLDEARLSLNFNHANIVSVFDIGKSANAYFIVMEYVEGTNLKYILQYMAKQRRALPIPLAVWVLNEILKGLDYAHELRDPESGSGLGIVHRDISPPNILVSWNGEVKLTDFGLAKASTQLESTDPGVVKGKFAYLAPEAAHGQEVDHRADIFAVGILAFEMLTGQRLFLADTDYDTVENVRKAEIPSMRAINPDIPPELEEIVRNSLARDAANRYQNASDFADDLLGFLFSRKLKVSARTLRALLDELRTKEPKAAPEKKAPEQANVILQLIEEEFTNFKSIDEDSDAPELGSQPLDSLMAGNAPIDYDPSAPLALADFDGQPAAEERDPTPAPSSSATAPDGMRGTGPHTPIPPAAAASGGRSVVPLVIVFVLLAAVIGAAVYIFVLS